MRALAIVVMAAALAGCSETMQTQFEYIDRVSTLSTDDGDWRIREHPQQDRLMVTPGWGRIITGGTVRGWTLGMVDIMPDDVPVVVAARQHMANTGRGHCRPISAQPLMEPHYEVVFDCSRTSAS